MDSELLRTLSEEIRETRNLIIETIKQTEETRKQTDEIRKQVELAKIEASASVKKADAAWELVIMTRNQIKEELAYMRLPWWKKLVGANA